MSLIFKKKKKIIQQTKKFVIFFSGLDKHPKIIYDVIPFPKNVVKTIIYNNNAYPVVKGNYAFLDMDGNQYYCFSMYTRTQLLFWDRRYLTDIQYKLIDSALVDEGIDVMYRNNKKKISWKEWFPYALASGSISAFVVWILGNFGVIPYF